MRLNKEEFEHLIPSSPGTAQGHHCKEGRGNDKLYVTKRDDGIVLAFCHHCGGKGYVGPDKRISRGYSAMEADSVQFPYDTEFDYTKWHSDAVNWVFKYGLRPAEVKAARIGYSSKQHRVILPVVTDHLVGYQARLLRGDGPKYITTRCKGESLFYLQECPGSDTLVVVEDMLSAIKCGRVTNSIALLGTNINNDILKIISKYKRVLLFLDNDNSIVNYKRVEHIQKLELVCNDVVCIFANKDPKEHSLEELKELLK